jgi:hypothetical protein
MHTMTAHPYDWRHLSNILQELRSFDHRFRSALNFFEIENAITNAARSRVVPVRGRRDNGLSSLSSAFERIEKYLGPKTYVEVSLNRVTIPDDGAVLGLPRRMNLLQPQMNPGIFPGSTTVTIPGSGAAGRFTDVQADSRAVEKWIRENAMPRGWQGAAAEEGTQTRRGPKPKYAWDAIREETFRLMDKNGDFSDDKPEWDRQARLEDALLSFCAGKEPAHSTLQEKLPGWLADWHRQKAVGN